MECVAYIAGRQAVETPDKGDNASHEKPPPGFGGLFESMLASEQGEHDAEERRRGAGAGAGLGADGVGMSTVGCHGDGGPGGQSSDRPQDGGGRAVAMHGASSGESSERRRDGEHEGHSKGLINNDKSGIGQAAGGGLDDRDHSSDRALTAVLENLVRRLHQEGLAEKPGAGLVVGLGDLGEVKIDVRFAGRTMLVRAEVADQRAAALLTTAVPELRARLAALGWRLGRLELRTPGGTSLPQAGERGVVADKTKQPVGRPVGTHDGALDVLA